VRIHSLNYPAILERTVQLALQIGRDKKILHLDIGSGHGDLISLLRDKFDIESCGLDYTSTLMKLDRVRVDVVDLNSEPLPYQNDFFDLITCTEVIEHIEHYRFTLREIYRILRPGGLFIISTPNVLNLRSRLRYLFFGFFNLFGPLSFHETNIESTDGHINPVSSFYLAHSLIDAGFKHLITSVDKLQRGTLPAFFLLYPFIKFISIGSLFWEKYKHNTVNSSNMKYVLEMSSINILLGRTLIISCHK
jgi:ubiquinone/menaquinone biosynthesis C-methylase UbiE